MNATMQDAARADAMAREAERRASEMRKARVRCQATAAEVEQAMRMASMMARAAKAVCARAQAV